MPKVNKRKKVSVSEDEKSSSSSDSGPDDRNPPPKTAASKGTNASSGSAKNTQQNPPGDAEPSWQLDKQRVVKVRSWKGKTYIDIREYYEKDGKQLPGKKGISLSATQWNKFKSFIQEIDKAVEEI